MGSKPPSAAAIAVSILFALSCFCATLFVWKSFGGTSPLQAQGYRFRASFGSEATNLTGGSSVRIAGVPVGKVVKVEPQGGRFEATMELKSRYAPIPEDARAITRIKTLLGETFVELTPGSPNAPKLPENGELRRQNIGNPQGVDQVLGAFDKVTRDQFKDFLADFAIGLNGRGRDLNAILGNATPATQELQRLVDVLDQEQPAVRSLVRDAGTALNAVGDRASDVQSLVRSGNELFAATAARDRELTAAVRAFPPFLRDARAALKQFDGVAADAAPTLRTLRPVAPLVRPGLVEATRLGPLLTRTFRQSGPLLDASGPGLKALTRTLKAARPLMKVLEDAGRESVPVLQYVNGYRNELVTAIANLGAATNAVDGRGQKYLRVVLPLLNELIAGTEKRAGTYRGNAYMRPGGMNDLATGLQAASCKDAGNPNILSLGSGAPPCKQATPQTFMGKTGYYPQVQRAAP